MHAPPPPAPEEKKGNAPKEKVRPLLAHQQFIMMTSGADSLHHWQQATASQAESRRRESVCHTASLFSESAIVWLCSCRNHRALLTMMAKQTRLLLLLLLLIEETTKLLWVTLARSANCPSFSPAKRRSKPIRRPSAPSRNRRSDTKYLFAELHLTSPV